MLNEQPTDTFFAERTDGHWTVVDPAGGRWWPDAHTEAAIDSYADPKSAAVRICQEQPMRGTWRC